MIILAGIILSVGIVIGIAWLRALVAAVRATTEVRPVPTGEVILMILPGLLSIAVLVASAVVLAQQ